MATSGKKGSDALLKVDITGALNFVTLAGLQSKSIRINSDTVDISNSDSASKHRELLEGAGILKLSLSASGVFDDSAAQNTMVGYSFAQSIRTYQLIMPSLGTFQGLFQISSLDLKAPHDKEVSFDISLESAGLISYTPS